jgi:hypothetical protein
MVYWILMLNGGIACMYMELLWRAEQARTCVSCYTGSAAVGRRMSVRALHSPALIVAGQ